MTWADRIAAALAGDTHGTPHARGANPVTEASTLSSTSHARKLVRSPVAATTATYSRVAPARKAMVTRAARPVVKPVLTRYLTLRPSFQIGVVANVPPPKRVDPVAVGDVLLFPGDGVAMYLAARPVGLSTALTVRTEEVDGTVRTTAGNATVSCTLLPVLDDTDLAARRQRWITALEAAGYPGTNWRFSPLHLRSVQASIDVPADHLTGSPTASAGSDTADGVFVLDLTARGAQAWEQALTSRQTDGIVGAVKFTVSFAAESDGRLRTQTHTLTGSLGAVIADASFTRRNVRGEIGVPARLLVRGHPTIDRVALTLHAGDDVETATIGADGGEVSMALATTDTDAEAIRWDAEVSFASSTWPIITTHGELSDDAGWSTILAPATWSRTIDVMVVLVDSDGRTSTPDGTEIVNGNVRYHPADPAARMVAADFEGRHQQMAAVVIPSPPTGRESAEPRVELSMLVLRGGHQEMISTTIGPDDRWVLVRVRPDATVEFATNGSPASEHDPLRETRRALTTLFDE